jgi:chromosome segregation ATPase
LVLVKSWYNDGVANKKTKPTDLDDIAEAIGLLATHIDERFAQVDERFARVDERFAQVDERFAQIDQRFEQMDRRLVSIESRLTSLERGQGELRDWVERIDSRLYGVESDIKEIYDWIVRLEKQLKQVKQASDPKRLERLEKQVAVLTSWARQVSKRHGIPLPKS